MGIGRQGLEPSMGLGCRAVVPELTVPAFVIDLKLLNFQLNSLRMQVKIFLVMGYFIYSKYRIEKFDNF